VTWDYLGDAGFGSLRYAAAAVAGGSPRLPQFTLAGEALSIKQSVRAIPFISAEPGIGKCRADLGFWVNGRAVERLMPADGRAVRASVAGRRRLSCARRPEGACVSVASGTTGCGPSGWGGKPDGPQPGVTWLRCGQVPSGRPIGGRLTPVNPSTRPL
jgi:hypothetical protein